MAMEIWHGSGHLLMQAFFSGGWRSGAPIRVTIWYPKKQYPQQGSPFTSLDSFRILYRDAPVPRLLGNGDVGFDVLIVGRTATIYGIA